jgi:hypothetical protein
VVAARIAATPHASVWPAVVAFHISYRHALAIRAGWRGAGRWAPPIPYRGRSMDNGQRHGWLAARELRVIEGGRKEETWTKSATSSA